MAKYTSFLEQRVAFRGKIFTNICHKVSSVPNGPGARQGPADGLPRARDRTGRQKICRPRPQNIKTAVLGGGRQGTMGICGGLQETGGTAGDGRGR